MRQLIEQANLRPIGTIMIFLACSLLGSIALIDLPIEFLPEIEVPSIIVSTVYPSASSEDVRNLITIPLENALSSVKGLKDIRSVSRNSFSTIELILDWGVDRLPAELQVREIIDSQYSILPEQSFKPQVIPSDSNQGDLLIVGFLPQTISLAKMKQLVNIEIRTELQQVSGVGQTTFVGGREEEIVAALNPVLLTSRGLTPQALTDQFRQIHNRYPAGSFNEGSREFLVIGDAELKNIQSMRDLIIYPGGTRNPFRLSEIASVQIEEKEQRSLFYFNNYEGVGLLIRKQPGANPMSVANQVRSQLQKIHQDYGGIFDYEILYNAADVTQQSVQSIVQSLLLGILIAFLVLLIITKRVFISLLTVVTLPVSLLLAFLGMRIFGLSINTMSLGGIAIAVGMLVDNGVIVVENIDAKTPLGYSIAEATAQVASANFGSTMTSIIVFLPLIFLPGIIGAVYRELAITVALSLLASYLVAIFLLPVLYSLGVKAYVKTTSNKASKNLSSLTQLYSTQLKRFIRNKYLAFLIILLIILATVFLSSYIVFELADPEDSKEILLEITSPPGTRMVELRNTAQTINQILSQYDWIASVYFRAGAEPEDTSYFANPMSASHILYGTVVLSPSITHHRSFIAEELNRILANLGDKVSVSLPPDAVSRLFGLTDNRKSWLITSQRFENLQSVAKELSISDVDIFPSGTSTSISMTPIRDMLDRSGISPALIHEFFQSQIQGLTAGQMEIDGERLDIRFRAQNGNQMTVEDLENLRIPLSEQTSLRTGDVVNVAEVDQPSALYRDNRRDAILVYSLNDDFLREDSLVNNTNHEIYALVDSLIESNGREIGLLLIIAVVFLYLLLGAQFESFSAPAILLITVPLSLLGVFLGLLIGGKTLNLNSGLGILVLLGLVVNSAILLRERSNQLLSPIHGKPYSVINAAKERFRPILITVATTVFSLFPIGLELFGPTQQSGLAWVIIGGLSISTLLSLFIIPWLSIGRGK